METFAVECEKINIRGRGSELGLQISQIIANNLLYISTQCLLHPSLNSRNKSIWLTEQCLSNIWTKNLNF